MTTITLPRDNWTDPAAHAIMDLKAGDTVVCPTPAIKAAVLNGIRALKRVKDDDVNILLEGEDGLPDDPV